MLAWTLSLLRPLRLLLRLMAFLLRRRRQPGLSKRSDSGSSALLYYVTPIDLLQALEAPLGAYRPGTLSFVHKHLNYHGTPAVTLLGPDTMSL